MKTLTILALLMVGCGGIESPDPVTGEATAPTVGTHWILLAPDPALIVGEGGCYKLADSTATEADCHGLPAGFSTTDDACQVTCVDTPAGADVTLTCGRCTGHYAVTFTP